MKDKISRQQTIRKYIEKHSVSDQSEILKHCQKMGYKVTQATVSRDLNEMNVAKIRSGAGFSQYIFPKEEMKNTLWNKLAILFNHFVLKILSAENQIVIRTTPGNANGVASYIDRLDIDGIIGTIAGDDTILVISKDIFSRRRLEKSFNKMLKNGVSK